MKYLNPEEIRRNREALREKFSRSRPLPLKGRAVDIFYTHVGERTSKILDVGTGTGNFIAAISHEGYLESYGCDIDDYVNLQARKLFQEFKVIDVSFEPLPWPDGFFDAVTAWEVLEHLENPHHALREIYRVLKPRGLLIFSVPNVFHIVSRLIFLKRGLFPRWNETNPHISIFPHGIFEKTFLKYFELIKEGYVHAKISLPLLNKITFLPENQWFGNWVYYVLKKK